MTTILKKKKVLGINIDDVSMEEAVEKVEQWLEKSDPKKNHSFENIDSWLSPKIIVTPGPEFLVTAQKDIEFQNVLNSADLAVPDGIGLHLAGIRNRVPGVDLMLELCKKAVKENWTIGMIGNPNTVAAAKELAQRYPGLKIKYSLDNPEADRIKEYYDIDKYDSDRVQPIKLSPVDLLFVGLGHPKQEKLLARARDVGILQTTVSKTRPGNLSIRNPQSAIRFRVGMGVGGSFDFISGRIWEPGKIFNKLGIKWLGRLLSNPRHAFRIWKALVVFPLLVIVENIRESK